jgi:hypothetical protein
MSMENLRNGTDRGKPIYSEHACPGALLYTANPKSTGPCPPNTLRIRVTVGTVRVCIVPESKEGSMTSGMR